MNTPPSGSPSNHPTGTQAALTENARRARRIYTFAFVLLAAMTANAILSFQLGIQTGFWQHYVRGGVVTAFWITTASSILLTRRRRYQQAGWINIIGLWATLFVTSATSAFFSDFGIVLGGIAILITTVIATITLSQKQAGRAILFSVVVGGGMVALDIFHPSAYLRLPASPDLKTAIPISAAIITILITIFIWTQIKSFSLRGKLLTTIFTSVLLATAAVGGYSFYTSITSLTTQTQKQLLAELQAHSTETTTYLANVRSDALFLSQFTTLTNYLEIAKTNPSSVALANARAALETDLFAFAQVREIYHQVRFIDATGMEIVQINTSQTGESIIVPESQLQNKGAHYYFLNGIGITSGEVYISPLDLNVEQGQIEVPHNPMIHYTTPVVHNGRTAGVIVVNVFAANFLDLLAASDAFLMLVDTDGYYLHHPDEEKRWGRDLGSDTIDQDYPNLAANLFSVPSQTQITSGFLSAHETITLAGESAPRWALITILPTAEIITPTMDALTPGIGLMFGVVLIISLIATFISQGITAPISQLAQTAQEISDGNLEIRTNITTEDEVGMLAQAFDAMTDQLRNLIVDLEKRVVSRTAELEKQSRNLQAATEVSAAASTILDTNQLVRQVVELIRARFELYYVGLFLTDETGEWAVLRSGTGQAGQLMQARGHRIQVGAGMVGWSIENAQARISLEAGEDAVRLATAELPETRSEAAIPVRSRGQVLGALTVQDGQPNAFDDEAISALQTMADQIGVALDNARLFAESQNALDATRRAYGEISHAAWVDLLSSQRSFRFRYSNSEIHPIEPGAESPAREQVALTGRSTQTTINGKATLILPIKVRRLTIGTLKLPKPASNQAWTKQEITMLETLAAQLGVALESARLFEESHRRAAQERHLGEATSRMRETLDIEAVLKTAAQEIQQVLGLQDVTIRLQGPVSQKTR